MSRQGSIILAALGSLLLSLIALGLLGHVLLHERINGARNGKIWLSESMYQHLFLYLHRFREKIAAVDLNSFAAPEQDFFNQDYFGPDQIEDTTITCRFTHQVEGPDDFKKTLILGRVEARSPLGPYRWLAELQITLLSGNVPLPMIPFYGSNPVENEGDSPPDTPAIHLDPSQDFLSGRGEAQVDIRGFLADCFQIGRTQLNWINLRLKLGLEAANEPPVDGIYLYLLEGRLRAIFIQGNVDNIRFFILDDRQVFEIEQQGKQYQLAYEPAENDCRCWDPRVADYFTFDQKIIVNGNIISLTQKGETAFLAKTGLELLVAGSVVIRSNLLTGSGDPAHPARTNLILICGLGDMFNQPGRVARVKVDAGEETTIEASLVVDGTFENRSERLNVRGSLAARAVDNRGHIDLEHRVAGTDLSEFLYLNDSCFISRFLITSVEEAYNE